MTSGQVHDIKGAIELLKSIPETALIADKAYDSQTIIDQIETQNAVAVIPSKKNRKNLDPLIVTHTKNAIMWNDSLQNLNNIEFMS